MTAGTAAAAEAAGRALVAAGARRRVAAWRNTEERA